VECGAAHEGPGLLCEACDQIILEGPVGEAAPDAANEDSLLGQYLDGRYELQSLLGQGGAGRVYRAREVELDRPVAIKVLLTEIAQDPIMNARFLREARAASQLTHPNAVTIHTFGEWEGRLYIVMEFLKGQSMADILDAEHPLDEERVARLLGQVCEVLVEAHARGLVHRDLKPENVMVVIRGGREQVKVVDFGLAIVQDTPADERLTQDQTVVGTPAYMSPEQCRGQDVDASSDIYALGGILYELLTGDVPFEGNTVMDLMIKVILATPEAPSVRVSGRTVNRRLEALCLRALSKQPSERPGSAAEFGEVLRRAVGDEEEPKAGRFRGGAAVLARFERAKAVGLETVPEPIPLAEAGLAVLCVEPHSDRLDSVSTVARGLGFDPSTVTTLEQAAARPRHAEVLLVDLRGESAESLQTVSERPPTLADLPVVIIGPDNSHDQATAANALGFSNYVSSGMMLTRLPKSITRAIRRAQRKPAPETRR